MSDVVLGVGNAVRSWKAAPELEHPLLPLIAQENRQALQGHGWQWQLANQLHLGGDLEMGMMHFPLNKGKET